MTVENQVVLKADEGKMLTNGDTFGKVVYLGKYDSTDNWHEVDETDVVEDLEESNKNIKEKTI